MFLVQVSVEMIIYNTRVGTTFGNPAWLRTTYLKDRFSKAVRGVADLNLFFLRDENIFFDLVFFIDLLCTSTIQKTYLEHLWCLRDAAIPKCRTQ